MRPIIKNPNSRLPKKVCSAFLYFSVKSRKHFFRGIQSYDSLINITMYSLFIGYWIEEIGICVRRITCIKKILRMKLFKSHVFEALDCIRNHIQSLSLLLKKTISHFSILSTLSRATPSVIPKQSYNICCSLFSVFFQFLLVDSARRSIRMLLRLDWFSCIFIKFCNFLCLLSRLLFSDLSYSCNFHISHDLFVLIILDWMKSAKKNLWNIMVLLFQSLFYTGVFFYFSLNISSFSVVIFVLQLIMHKTGSSYNLNNDSSLSHCSWLFRRFYFFRYVLSDKPSIANFVSKISIYFALLLLRVRFSIILIIFYNFG